jgi:hypothetical protein
VRKINIFLGKAGRFTPVLHLLHEIVRSWLRYGREQEKTAVVKKRKTAIMKVNRERTDEWKK